MRTVRWMSRPSDQRGRALQPGPSGGSHSGPPWSSGFGRRSLRRGLCTQPGGRPPEQQPALREGGPPPSPPAGIAAGAPRTSPGKRIMGCQISTEPNGSLVVGRCFHAVTVSCNN